MQGIEMPRMTSATSIADDFGFEKFPELKKWLEKEFPTVDPDATMIRFIEYAEDSGRMASKWTACFKRIVRCGMENNWKGICVFKKGKSDDPRWAPIINEVKPYGFRAPQSHETPGSYRTEFELWKGKQKRSSVISFGDALKKFG